MSDAVHRLVYVSRNRIEGDETALHREVDDILATARRRNREAGVTGALMFNTGCFAQVLEGPHDAIQATFERIQCDLRHARVVVLSFERVPERRFAQWSMAYVGENSDALRRFRHMTRESGFDPAALDGERVLELLHEHLLAAEVC